MALVVKVKVASPVAHPNRFLVFTLTSYSQLGLSWSSTKLLSYTHLRRSARDGQSGLQ